MVQGIAGWRMVQAGLWCRVAGWIMVQGIAGRPLNGYSEEDAADVWSGQRGRSAPPHPPQSD